jgi:hypothetical protein
MNLARDWPLLAIIGISAVDLFTGSIPFMGTLSNGMAETLQLILGGYLMVNK